MSTQQLRAIISAGDRQATLNVSRDLATTKLKRAFLRSVIKTLPDPKPEGIHR